MSQVVDIKSQIRNENQVAGNWLIDYRERKRSHDERRQKLLQVSESVIHRPGLRSGAFFILGKRNTAYLAV